MFQRVRTTPETSPPTVPTNDEQLLHEDLTTDEVKLVKQFERKQKRRTRAIATLSGAAIAFSTLSHAYWSDIETNRELSQLSQPEIRPIGEIDPLLDSSIFYLAGFDTSNGDVFGDRVRVAIHQRVPGNDMSIDYNDAPLDPKEIAEQIISEATEQKLDSISLAGNSLGGIVSMEVARYIILNSSIQIDAIFLNATPDGSKGLRPETQSDLAAMIDVLQFPGAKYSKFARYAITMLQESGRYTQGDSAFENISDFLTTSNTVMGWVEESRRPGAWLLVDQASAVTNANLKDIFEDIGEQRDTRRMPVIVTMRTTNPADDTVVDVEKSSQNICDYADAAGLNCEIVLVDGATHTSYQFDTEAYTAALSANTDEFKDALEDERTQYAYTQYGSYLAHQYAFGTKE